MSCSPSSELCTEEIDRCMLQKRSQAEVVQDTVYYCVGGCRSFLPSLFPLALFQPYLFFLSLTLLSHVSKAVVNQKEEKACL